MNEIKVGDRVIALENNIDLEKMYGKIGIVKSIQTWGAEFEYYISFSGSLCLFCKARNISPVELEFLDDN